MFGMFGEVKAAGFESAIAVILRIAKLHSTGIPLEKQSSFKVIQGVTGLSFQCSA